MRQQLMKIAFVIAAVIVLALVFEPAIKQLMYWSVVAEKTGRVVDESGKGLKDVAIISNWYRSGSDVAGSYGQCALQRVVTTNSNGEYRIPSARSDLHFERTWWKTVAAEIVRLKAPSETYSWIVVPFKEGYFRAGDESDIRAASRAARQPDRNLKWYSSAPPFQEIGAGVVIDPIRLQRGSLSLEEQVIYQYALFTLSNCAGQDRDTSQVQRVFDVGLKERVCAEPPEAIVSEQAVRAVSTLADGADFKVAMKAAAGRNDYSNHAMTAGELCGALSQRAGDTR